MKSPIFNGLILAAVTLIGVTSSLGASQAVDRPSSSFSVTERTEIPGLTLQPGSYSIRVLDHLTDRMIIRIDSTKSETHSTFIGLRDPQLPDARSVGQIMWAKGPDNKKVVRGYTFPGGTTVEFVYPKTEAVSIAKANLSKVPAIDPASEGRISDRSLSRDDMELVTLWMLSPTTVGPTDQAAIQAVKFQAVSEPTISAKEHRASSNTVASDTNNKILTTRKPVISSLPHTGSNQGLILLLGVVSLLSGCILATRRTASS